MATLGDTLNKIQPLDDRVVAGRELCDLVEEGFDIHRKLILFQLLHARIWSGPDGPRPNPTRTQLELVAMTLATALDGYNQHMLLNSDEDPWELLWRSLLPQLQACGYIAIDPSGQIEATPPEESG